MRPMVEWRGRGSRSVPDRHSFARKVIPAWQTAIILAPSPRTGSQHATEAGESRSRVGASPAGWMRATLRRAIKGADNSNRNPAPETGFVS